MKIIERTYSNLPQLIPGIDMQSQLNTFARNNSLDPPTIRIHEKTCEREQSPTTIPIPLDISPFYSYTLHMLSPVSAELIIAPIERFDSNRYHSIIREDGAIGTRRGRAVYKLGTSVLKGEHEILGIAVSSPERGRRKTKDFQLAASISYSHVGVVENPDRYSEPERDMEGVINFLEAAETYIRRDRVMQ